MPVKCRVEGYCFIRRLLAGDVAYFKQEELAEAAKRELLEETSYSAAGIIFLCEGSPSFGLTDEIITLFLAEGLEKIGNGGGDHTEVIAVHEIPLKEVAPWLEERQQQGSMIDLRIYTAL